MKIVPPDGSRDPRIEDPTNRWIVHLAGRLLLPAALRLRLSANAISVAGFVLGGFAAWCFRSWFDWRLATIGVALCFGWMVADGLDGMVARATRTTSALGRFLDGVCDHAVFVLIYVAMATEIGSAEGWAWAISAGAAHAIQASLYEGERARFHRRLRGDPGQAAAPSGNPVVRGYDALAGSLDRLAAPFDRALAQSRDPAALGALYGARAAAPLRLMVPLTNNMRVIAIYAACLLGDPRYFWVFELAPLTLVAIAGMSWHRRIEAGMLRQVRAPAVRAGRAT